MAEWVNLSELGDRRCDAVRWNVRSIANENNIVTLPVNGYFGFSRRLGEAYPYVQYMGCAFRVSISGYEVTDKNLNDGQPVLCMQVSWGPEGLKFNINPQTHQGFYNDRDYNAVYENDEFMFEWTEPVYYYGCLSPENGYENIGGYEDVMDFIQVRLFEGEYEEPFEPQPTIEENLDRIRVAKEEMRNVIRSKNVTIFTDEPIQSYANKINEIRPNVQGNWVNFEDMFGNNVGEWYASDYGFDGFSSLAVDANDFANQKWQEGYNEGVAQGGGSGTAEVLDVTENGTYYTQYADYIPEWTEPETGDDFYSYITAQENALSTGYKGDTNTVVELWYRHYGDVSNGVILQRFSYSNAFKLMLTEETGNVVIGSNTFDFYLPAYQFNKIRFSTKGIWVNDEQVSEFDVEYTNDSPIWEIGGAGNLAQGDYGMIKIDDNVYIPTADGFLNTATNELLPSVGSSVFKFSFTEVAKPVIYENLFKQVNVNFKISVEETGLKLAYSDCKSIPDFIDFSNISGERLVNFFNNAAQMEDVSRLGGIDTSKITSLVGIFYYCTNLTDLTPIGSWDTSNVIRMYNMFGTCTKLTTIPALDCSSVDTSYNSTGWFGSANMTALTDMGGFINLKTSSTGIYGLNKCPNLTYESCINILNGLYDFTGNGETPSSSQGQLKVHQNFLDLVGDEITIGTNKGWTITA